MSAIAWQKVTVRVESCAALSQINCGGSKLVDTVISRRAASETLAVEALKQVVAGHCKGEMGFDEVYECTPVGPIQTELEKPNWVQRVGIKVSDFFSSL